MADGDFLHESLSGVTALRNELQRYAAAPQDGPQGLIGRHYTEDAYFDHEKDTVSNCVARIDYAGDGLFFWSDTQRRAHR